MIQKRLDLAGKQQRAVGAAAVVERLYAEHIPGAEKHLRPAVPQRKGEHPPQPGEQFAAPLLPPMQQHLGVGAGGKGVAQGRQFGGQFAIVVDFAVEHDDEIFIFAVQRLCAALQINDGQAAVAQRGGSLHKRSLAVRPAVGDARQHRGQRCGVRPGGGDQTGNSAHIPASFPGSATCRYRFVYLTCWHFTTRRGKIMSNQSGKQVSL